MSNPLTALITGVHVPETIIFQLLLQKLRKGSRAAPESWYIAKRNSSRFHIYRRRGIAKEHRYFYIVILISLILPWYQIGSNLLPRPLPIKISCGNITGSSN
ncbi:MAG TPA: hypothetical protein VFR94_15535 [Nitrososphaeraceae archaeon]|nr:hypothetical protein [Nitrososphaeraceae archaeon]